VAPDSAILLVRTVAERQLVVRRCRRAAARGITEGMTLAHARALLGGMAVDVHVHDPARDEAALAALARWLIRFAPRTAPDPPDGLLADISGCRRLYPSEEGLIERIAERIEGLGVHARIACASTFGCAWAVARFGAEPCTVVPDRCEREAMGGMPVDALRAGEAVTAALRDVGVERVEHVLALPRRELATRFGGKRFGGDLLLRLDQATGAAIEVLDAIRPVDPLQVQRVFNGPVRQLQAILITARQLVEQMADRLSSRESGLLKLDLTLDRADAAPIRLALRLSRPNRNAAHLQSLLQPRLERVNMGFGIERMALTATRTARIAHEQLSCRPEDTDDGIALAESRQPTADSRSFGELIDTLVDRFGPGRVVCRRMVESHVPERSFADRAAMGDTNDDRGCAQVTSSDRPSTLLEPPAAVKVIALTPEGPPLQMRWRGADHEIVSSFGPERIDHEWWTSPGSRDRDYYKVQTEAGQWLWLCRDLDENRWHVHGLWA
jgi:protein ImuB